METDEGVAKEVEWYRKHGRFMDRLTRDAHGRLYVIGDESWNRNHPDQWEYVEDHPEFKAIWNNL